jgi:Lipopolysaccharide-assembly
MHILKTTLPFLLLLIISCGSSNNKYSFGGSNISKDVKTFQVNYFQNKAEVVEPGIERTFTQKLQQLIESKTPLSLTNTGGDLVYEGEITQYKITRITATANQRAAQNRLTVTVNVRFNNTKNGKDNFEKPFSFYYDYDADKMLTGESLNTALDEIFERITQDIFNATLAKW